MNTQWIKERMSCLSLLLCIALTSSALTGCVSKILESKTAEPGVYVLHAGEAPVAGVAYPVTLSVALPVAAPGLDGDRIAVLTHRNQLDYFHGARWGGTAAQVMQSLLVSRLQAQQGLKNVSSEGLPVNADYLLALELRDFQAEYASDTAAPEVRVTLSGTLVQIKSRTSVSTLSASVVVRARDNRMSEVIAAFEAASQQAAQNVSTQLFAALGH